jgi:hypothetical protein
MFCGEGSLVNLGKSAIRAVTLRCRAWSCEDCRPYRQRDLVELLASGHPTTFLTLTVNPAIGVSPAARARALVDAWRVLVRRIERTFRIDHVPYYCVLEATKNGEPHLHILCRLKYIPQSWISNQMRALLEAPIVDIRSTKGIRKLARYLSKYLGKDPHRFGTCKRYWGTRDWREDAAERDPEDPIWSDAWFPSKYSLAALTAVWKMRGWDVQLEDGTLVAMDPDPP